MDYAKTDAEWRILGGKRRVVADALGSSAPRVAPAMDGWRYIKTNKQQTNTHTQTNDLTDVRGPRRS